MIIEYFFLHCYVTHLQIGFSGEIFTTICARKHFYWTAMLFFLVTKERSLRREELATVWAHEPVHVPVHISEDEDNVNIGEAQPP